MFTILVVVRKNEKISTEKFREIWKNEYGPLYKKLPQVVSYQQYHLSDKNQDGDGPIDGVAIMTFSSKEKMKEAMETDLWHEAAKMREGIMSESSKGIHVTSVDEMISIID